MKYKRKRKAAREEIEGGKGAGELQQGWIKSPLVGARAQGTGFGASRGPRVGKMLVFDGGWHIWMEGKVRGLRWM